MDNTTTSKGTDPERRASLRQSRRISVQNGLDQHGLDPVQDDDDSLYAFGGMVSDGFRPQMSDTYDQAPSSFVPGSSVTHDFRPNSSVYPPDSSIYRPDSLISRPESASFAPPVRDASSPRPAVANRSSISKGRRTSRDSFTLRHDGGMGPIQGSALSRASSTSTDAPYIANETPYQGPSGPSHNYEMYSQDTRAARTMSVATTTTTSSTLPARESLYDGPRGPSHPYSMYPQIPVEGPSSDPPVPAIPVGFSSTPDQYQRRLGPEGEEIAAMIGPDGHTEELPPYTRYPDEAYLRKIRDNESLPHAEGSSRAASATALPTVAVLHSIPGAGGIGLAPRNPEFDSADDLNSPQSRQSTRSFAGDSHHEINAAAADMSEKKPLNKYQRLAKRKACGVVPYWAICLTTFAVIAVAVIVGAVFGTIFSGKHKKPPQGGNSSSQQEGGTPTVTVTFDATPIPTPTDLPDIPSGIYGLPLTLNKSPNTCFNDTTQTQAWACNIIFGFGSQMELSITKNAPQLGNKGNYNVFIDSNDSLTITENVLAYGSQPPLMNPAMPMELVNDTFDLSRGPAWFRMLPYNKTVIVEEDRLSVTSTTSKARRNGGGYPPGPGDFKRKGVAQVGDKPWICTWPDTVVEVFVYVMQNSSFAVQTGTTPPSMITPTATSSVASATASISSTSSDSVPNFTPMPPYPRALKVKERRVKGAPQPYCLQVEVQSDNSTLPVTDASGEEVKIFIVENEPGPAMAESSDDSSKSNRRDLFSEMFRRDGNDGDMSDCGCMWFSS